VAKLNLIFEMQKYFF